MVPACNCLRNLFNLGFNSSFAKIGALFSHPLINLTTYLETSDELENYLWNNTKTPQCSIIRLKSIRATAELSDCIDHAAGFTELDQMTRRMCPQGESMAPNPDFLSHIISHNSDVYNEPRSTSVIHTGDGLSISFDCFITFGCTPSRDDQSAPADRKNWNH